MEEWLNPKIFISKVKSLKTKAWGEKQIESYPRQGRTIALDHQQQIFFPALKAREPIYNKNRIASGYTAHKRTSVFWGQLPYPAIKPDFKLEVMDRL